MTIDLTIDCSNPEFATDPSCLKGGDGDSSNISIIFYIMGSLVFIMLMAFVVNRFINMNKLKNAKNDEAAKDEEQMKKEYEEYKKIRSLESTDKTKTK